MRPTGNGNRVRRVEGRRDNGPILYWEHWVLLAILLILLIGIGLGVLSSTWGFPNAMECVDEPSEDYTPAMSVEVTADRARGYIMERNVFGCTVFFYQNRGDGDAYR